MIRRGGGIIPEPFACSLIIRRSDLPFSVVFSASTHESSCRIDRSPSRRGRFSCRADRTFPRAVRRFPPVDCFSSPANRSHSPSILTCPCAGGSEYGRTWADRAWGGRSAGPAADARYTLVPSSGNSTRTCAQCPAAIAAGYHAHNDPKSPEHPCNARTPPRRAPGRAAADLPPAVFRGAHGRLGRRRPRRRFVRPEA